MKERLIELLLERSFLYSDKPIFKLASGKMSNYYINCKPTTMDPEGLYLIGNLLYDTVKDWNIKAAGGLTMGADPLAYALAYTSFLKGDPIKAFVIRKEPKDHGTQKLIEGPVNPGERVVILEDVITTGGSTLKAIKAAEDFGLKIGGVVVLVDRQEGGKERVEAAGYRVYSIVRKEELLEVYRREE